MSRRRVLTIEQIAVIRKLHAEGYSYGRISKLFAVGESTIRDHVHFYRAYSA